MVDPAFLPAVDIARLIRRKQLSPVEVVRNSLGCIERVNPKLNAFCFVYADEALAKARAAERALTSGQSLAPLHGVPIAIKDLTPTKGKRTTMGSYLRENWIPEADAVVVERLLAAGAIMVGKTTTPEFACALTSSSPLWGVTRNPWNPERTPGFSSAGSAVAVATGCVPLAEGSDAGGSIRGPAAYCGIVGLKPSFARIPFEIMPSQLDPTCHFGPLARTIDDAALFLSVTQGPDDRDLQAVVPPIEIPIPVPDDVRGRRLAFSVDFGYAAINPEVEANLRGAARGLEELGATVEEVDLRLSKAISEMDALHWDVYAALLVEKEWAELDRWRDKLDPRFRASVERGLKAKAVDLKRSEFVATELWKALRPVFQRYDALICPSTLTPALHIDFSPDEFGFEDASGKYHARHLLGPFNMVGSCPSLAVPTGFTNDGLPTSLQIVGRRHDDLSVLRVGKALERLIGWPAWRPPHGS